MKKFWWIGALVAAAVFAFYFMSKIPSSQSKEYTVGSPEWKYNTAEVVQPRNANFEQLKYQESDETDMRGPASKEKKK